VVPDRIWEKQTHGRSFSALSFSFQGVALKESRSVKRFVWISLIDFCIGGSDSLKFTKAHTIVRGRLLMRGPIRPKTDRLAERFVDKGAQMCIYIFDILPLISMILTERGGNFCYAKIAGIARRVRRGVSQHRYAL